MAGNVFSVVDQTLGCQQRSMMTMRTKPRIMLGIMMVTTTMTMKTAMTLSVIILDG